MDIYSAEEKDEVLKSIVSMDYTSIDDKRAMSIIDEYLYPLGLIEKPLRLSNPDHYICVSTQKGKDFLSTDGFTRIKREEDEKMSHEIERQELVQLQKEELIYKKKIRLWQFLCALFALLSTILGAINFFLK